MKTFFPRFVSDRFSEPFGWYFIDSVRGPQIKCACFCRNLWVKCSETSKLKFFLDSRCWSCFSWPFFRRKTSFHFKIFFFVFLIRFYLLYKSWTEKSLIEMSRWAFRSFLIQGYICFHFFISVDLNKFTKRCLNALTPNLS